MSAVKTLPHWDMSGVFPSLDSPAFEAEFGWVVTRIGELADEFDASGIGRTEKLDVDAEAVRRFEQILASFGDLIERLTTLQVYIRSFVSTDSRDADAQARLSELQQHMILLSQLDTRLTAWLGSFPVEDLIQASPVAAQHQYMLRKAQTAARHLLPQESEDLLAQLEPTGGSAWSKLHSNMTSQLLVPIELDGSVQELPMPVVRNLALNEDRDVRRTAYFAELAAWERVAVPLAAALNSIKGESNTLDAARGWGSVLDVALFNNNIDRETLDAMMGAARESFPDFRRYLRAKARALGLDRLAWYDISAPVGSSAQTWQFDDSVEFLLRQFGAYSPRLREFGERAFRERWIDAEPREGKQGGAFCTWLRPGESRILSNFVPSYNGMATLAHELGHAYHNEKLASRSPFQRAMPMTLAETASTFCETLVQEAALEQADAGERLLILEAALQDACMVVVDITSRFQFETAVIEARKRRELSVPELNRAMLDSQRDTYGDALDPEALHPYMWAVKGHYYSTARPYYNFPYMFGLLFGLGLYARYRDDPVGFRAGYDELLSSTGLADAGTLAGRFDIDIRSDEFWRRSLDVLRGNIDRFETLVGDATSRR